MAIWNPWRGCHRYSTGCKFCYIHKGDYKKGIDTNIIKQTEKFYDLIEKKQKWNLQNKIGANGLCMFFIRLLDRGRR